MERLGYTSPEELLAEKFHMSQDLLRRLNPDASFDQAGQEIVVANVENQSLPRKISRLEVDAEKQRVKVYDEDNNLIAIYPATVGSEDRPSPKGEFKVTAISENPVYPYDPSLNLRGVHVKEKLQIPPGPNNPVGAVWISLSAEGYGIHGTPEPDKISKSASHGCVRLTNWDALDLARNLNDGTPVSIVDFEKTGNVPSQGSTADRLRPANAPGLPERNPPGALAPQIPPLRVRRPHPGLRQRFCRKSEMYRNTCLPRQPRPPLKEGLCGAPAPILLKSIGSDPERRHRSSCHRDLHAGQGLEHVA